MNNNNWWTIRFSSYTVDINFYFFWLKQFFWVNFHTLPSTNSVAQLVFLVQTKEDIGPLLCVFHQLTNPECIQFLLWILMTRCGSGILPHYLAKNLRLVSDTDIDSAAKSSNDFQGSRKVWQASQWQPQGSGIIHNQSRQWQHQQHSARFVWDSLVYLNVDRLTIAESQTEVVNNSSEFQLRTITL